MKLFISSVIYLKLLASVSTSHADTPMLLPITPGLSPDGSTLVFSWEDDLWKVSTDPTKNEPAQRLTIHPAMDFNPFFSPDGSTIFYNSNKEGTSQVFSMSLNNTAQSKQISFHSEYNILEDISQNSNNLTMTYRSRRDAAGRNPNQVFQAPVSADKPEKKLFDAFSNNTKISPDGKKVLLVREGARAYRTGYHGSQASQIWLYDIATKSFTQPVANNYGCLSPLWLPDNSGFYYVCGKGGHFNIWKHNLATATCKQITTHSDANVMFPVISRDGSTIVYRHLFSFYKLNTNSYKSLKLNLKHNLPLESDTVRNMAIKSTRDADFSPSGLEIAFTAKGNIFAMDTVLREPIQLTKTAAYESNVYFADKGKALYYIHDDGIKTSINKLTKENPFQYWWKADKIKIETVIPSKKNTTIKSFTFSPNAKMIGYTTANGKLFIYNRKTRKSHLVARSWNAPAYDWSPNSEWITYSLQDDNYNSDIYVVPVDGSQKPTNITKHPDNEFAPSFSPDGKKIAFLGKRHGTNYDLYYVDLTPRGSEKTSRQKKLDLAKKAMIKDKTYIKPKVKLKSDKTIKPEKLKDKPAKKLKSDQPKIKSTIKANSEKLIVIKNLKDNQKVTVTNNTVKGKIITIKPTNTPTNSKTKTKVKTKVSTKPKLKYDLKDIQKRIRHIPVKGTVSRLFWKSDSKSILTQTGSTTYAISLKTRKVSKYIAASGLPIRYDKRGNLLWISNGSPGIVKGTSPVKYSFTAQTEFNRIDHQRYKFRLIWRTIGAGFYDESLNGLDWRKIRLKYENAATQAKSAKSFDRIITMLLGELNASHMGYAGNFVRTWKKSVPWREEILHLGAKYEAKEDGWHITSILANSPASGELTKLEKGEIIIEINGNRVNNKTLVRNVLLGQLKNSIELKVLNTEGQERNVSLKPISYRSARSLAKKERINNNKMMVEKLSKGKFGYIHVARMVWSEFKQFEQHLYENGADKEGLIIDVRDNGGGFTSDHLLTALTQPRHAYTVPRNGGLGYPQDRFVYATWEKPIVVLCNQNSFSNAEIFSHAIKTLKRGKLVGVPTAGGVISTGSVNILGEGKLRMPFRGWFLTNGDDMELNGASPEPGNIIWTTPGELETGIDKQIRKAVGVLADEVKLKKKSPVKPKYRNN